MRNNTKLVRAFPRVNPALPALAAAAAATIGSIASAALNIYEPFNYSVGQLQGNTNNNGGTANGKIWLQAGVGNPPPGINVTAGSLTGPSQIPASVGNSLAITHVTTGDGASNRLALNQNYTTGTVYYSFLLSVPNLTNSNNTTGAFFFSLNNTGDASQTGNPSVQPGKVQIRIDPNDGTKFNLGVFGTEAATASSNAWAGDTLTPGNTYFVVGSVQAGATKETKLWISPDPATFGLANAPAFTAHDTDQTVWSGNNLQSVLVRQIGTLPNLTMDELRVGSTWSDVTPTLAAYWDINGATAGAGGATPNGTWDGVTANWSANPGGDTGTTAFPGAAYKAVFAAGSDATGAYTVTVSGSQTATALSVEDGSVTLTGGTVNLTTGVIDVSSSGTATISSNINSSAGLSKNGTGSAVLSGTLTYSGATTINAGTLTIGDGTTAGALPVGSVITNNGTLVFNRTDTVTQGVDFNGTGIGGTGNLTQGGTGNLVLNTANTYTGTTKATAGTLTVGHSLALQNSTLDTSGAGAIVFDNALTSASVGGLSGSTSLSANPALSLTIGNNVRNASYAGVISGTGSVTKVGSINQELSGANTYSGGTNINAGILQFGPTNSMPATGAVAVNSGGILSVHIGGPGEWTTGASGVGTVGGLINGDGGQTASQVTWNDGSSLALNTQPVGTTTGTADITYAGNIGNFNGVSDATKSVGFMKRGLGSLTLTGNDTFRGQLQVANEGGTLKLPVALPNAGQSMTVPTIYVGNASSAANAVLEVLTNDAVPANSLINFGTAAGSFNPVFRLHDGDPTGLPAQSFNQTVRGFSGGAGLVQVGGGTLTINTPANETYSWTGTLRTDADANWTGGNETGVHGKVIKTGLGRQNLTQFNGGQIGEFVMQQGTVGVGDQQAFGSSAATHSKLTIQGGNFINMAAGSLSLQVKFAEIAGSFSWDTNGNNNSQFTNDHITLTAANPTITVNNSVAGGTGQLIFLADVVDNGAGFGFTKAGPGTLNFSPRATGEMNNYSGATTIQEGTLRVVALSRIGNGSSDVNLSGGTLEWNGTQGLTTNIIYNVTNPLHVTANSNIIYNSTTTTLNSLTLNDTNYPGGIEFQFDSNTFTNTGGTLTFEHRASAQGITYRPRFTGSGFNYSGPVVISNGGGTRKTVLESANTSGTQTWSGNITGDGTFSRLTGGNTVLGGALVSVGGVSIASNSSIRSAASAGNDHVVRANALTIGATNSTLDISNNKLITQAAIGVATGNTYGGVTGLIQSGRNGGAWNGTTGILTSQSTAAAGSLTTLGIATAQQVKGLATATSTGVWAGQTVTGSDTLVMYTYGGDATLDGKINVDDYGRIDSNAPLGVAGWYNGDFNYDGKINVDDYGIIDFNIGIQGAPFPTAGGASGLSGVSAVPEPASVGLLFAACGVATLKRSRRLNRAKKKDLA